MSSLLGLALLVLTAFVSPIGCGKIVVVKSPQSIQAAIDSAPAGASIIVRAGTYAEKLSVTKDGIHIIGEHGAVLVPPAAGSASASKTNVCDGLAGDGTVAGICIAGSGIELADFESEHRKVLSVQKYVQGITVEGFEVQGFNGLNIAVVGAQNTEVFGNTLSDGTAYGALTVGSKSTRITGNTVTSSDLKFIGICMDDQSDVSVSFNSLSNYGIGLCVQTNRARVSYNKVKSCCYGAFIDPGVDGARVIYNDIGPSSPLCNPYFGGFASGILVDGAKNSVVRYNKVSGTSDGNNPDNVAAGITVVDDPSSTALGNDIEFNALSNNEQDFFVMATGPNRIVHNKCSTPASICSKQ